MSRESAIRGGYATGYYQPMIVPMGATQGEFAELVAASHAAQARSDSVGAGALVFAGALVVLNLAISGFAASGVYKYSTRNKR